MLSTSERDRPHMARALVDSSRGVKCSAPSFWATSISSMTVQESSPFGPLTDTVWPSSVTVTPAGMVMGFLPIRDMALVHAQEDFAADIGVAGGVVRHDALGRRQDRDPKAVLDRLQVPDRRIDPPARLGDPGDLGDHRLPAEIIPLDLGVR